MSKVKKPKKCPKEVTLRGSVYSCERDTGHKLGHFATAERGQTVIKVGWFDKDTLN